MNYPITRILLAVLFAGFAAVSNAADKAELQRHHKNRYQGLDPGLGTVYSR